MKLVTEVEFATHITQIAYGSTGRWGKESDRDVSEMSGCNDLQIFSFIDTFKGNQIAADNSADYRLSRAAFMKSRKTR